MTCLTYVGGETGHLLSKEPQYIKFTAGVNPASVEIYSYGQSGRLGP